MVTDDFDPQDSVSDFFSLQSAETGLLVIDLQNAFLDANCAPGYGIVGAAQRIRPNLDRILETARKHHIPVIWTKSDHSAPYGGIILEKFPAIRNDKVLWAGEPSAEFHPDMPQPASEDYIVVKHKYDAFFETDLDAILRNLGISTLLIAGVGTSVCVDSTARSAFSRDYRVALLSDCTASLDEAAHTMTLRQFRIFFGRVVNSDEAIAELNNV
jgi:Amidases related to nicotinamidase